MQTCTCGHVDEEHEDTTLKPCTIDGCDCVAFDWDGEED